MHESPRETAKCLHRSGRMMEAEAAYRRALSVSASDADATHYLGLLLQQTGRQLEAVDFLQRSIALCPSSAEFRGNLASALGQMGRPADALAAADDAVRLNPTYAEGHANRGAALEKLGRCDEAIEALSRAIELRPGHAPALQNLGRLMLARGDAEIALQHLRESVRLDPKSAEANFALGGAIRALHLAGKLGPDGDAKGEAVAAFRKATQLRPGWAEAHCELAKALVERGRAEQAVSAFDKAIELRPDHPDAHWNLSLALLTCGELTRGWLEYEWRRHLSVDAKGERPFRQPAWAGQRLTGRTLLVICEQGLGDTLQFARFAALAAERSGAARIILECQPQLRPLLQSLAGAGTGGTIHVIARGEPLPPFDAHVRLMSVPGILGIDLTNLPADVPYLKPEPRLVEQWKARLDARTTAGGADASQLNVGIAWQGSKSYGADALRSIALSHFAPLVQVPGVRLWGLQKGEGREQLGESAGVAVWEFEPPLDDDGVGAFVDTAAVMAGLDLVVTSDTSIAHLAGALGVPVWVALPYVADWRWLRDREDSPWYPTMRLFRQRDPGNWAEVFQRIASQLQAMLDQRGENTSGVSVAVPVSPGELLDKVSILRIKAERIEDPEKLAHVQNELAELTAVTEHVAPPSPEVIRLVDELRATNESLWTTEDDLRLCERQADFGERFVELARSVYKTNDRRAELKRKLNQLLGAKVVEVKSYAAAEGNGRSAAALVTAG